MLEQHSQVILANSPVPGWDQLADHLRSALPAIGWSLVILIATYMLSRLASRRLQSTLQRGGFQLNVAILLGRTLWLAFWITGFLLILDSFGNGLTPFAAAVGVLGLAASLSLQAVLQNLVAGVYLLAERPFEIGDYIAVIGPNGVNHEGRVENIEMRTTHLRNQDNELILVPNSGIFTGVVTNRTAVGGFVQHLKVTFPRQCDFQATQERLLSILQGLPSVLTAPEPRLRVDQVTVDNWTGSLSLWARSYQAHSDAVWAIGQEFPDAGVNDSGTPV